MRHFVSNSENISADRPGSITKIRDALWTITTTIPALGRQDTTLYAKNKDILTSRIHLALVREVHTLMKARRNSTFCCLVKTTYGLCS